MERRDPAELLQEALDLDPEVRAALAASLLESLEQDIDEDVEAAWRAEIERRVAEIDSGQARLIPWSEVRDHLTGR